MKDLLIKAPLNPNHAPFPPSILSASDPLPKGFFIRKGFQREMMEIRLGAQMPIIRMASEERLRGWTAFSSYGYRDAERVLSN